MEALKECCANIVVYLHPSKAKKVEASVYRQLSSLLFKFNESLDGVVLTYEPKFSSNLAKILPGIHPYFGVRFEAKLLLFHPKPDMLLEGEVVKVGQQSIHIIVLGFSSAVIADEDIREDFKYKIILKQLDRIRRNFLWEGNKDHKFHLVKWIKVVMPKQMGGLGIKDLALHNKCLLMKWIWRYTQGDQAPRKEVIKQNKESKIIGNGIHIRFWKDRWPDNILLMEEFPRLFQIARAPNSSISQNREDNTWTVLFRRNLQDWEIEEVVNLFSGLEGQVINVHEADKLRWDSDKGCITTSMDASLSTLKGQEWVAQTRTKAQLRGCTGGISPPGCPQWLGNRRCGEVLLRLWRVSMEYQKQTTNFIGGQARIFDEEILHICGSLVPSNTGSIQWLETKAEESQAYRVVLVRYLMVEEKGLNFGDGGCGTSPVTVMMVTNGSGGGSDVKLVDRYTIAMMAVEAVVEVATSLTMVGLIEECGDDDDVLVVVSSDASCNRLVVQLYLLHTILAILKNSKVPLLPDCPPDSSGNYSPIVLVLGIWHVLLLLPSSAV
ncbi:hypothetical protein FXO37_05164 [Capsicum annuum]|nr:hypothetical protein FXO37_05164 [Capsicum annuum]